MTNNANHHDSNGFTPQHDELDTLLGVWHERNAERAAAGRDELLRAVAARRVSVRPRATVAGTIRPATARRFIPIAASLMLLATLAALLLPGPGRIAMANDEVTMVPQAGRLDALDAAGELLGPCALKHTDVDVDISGRFVRVTLDQRFHNPYAEKIEAVYTFPLSHRAAVDRMTMTVGDRVIEGEVKEREARQMYASAKAANRVASLLEQERPNIFTQSIANIEAKAEVTITISYVETITPQNGVFTFDFPMTITPRYIPGYPVGSPVVVPAELEERGGVVLLAPAALRIIERGEGVSIDASTLDGMLHLARSIRQPGAAWYGDATAGQGLLAQFEAVYPDASREFGVIYADGTGFVNDRWFLTDPGALDAVGHGFSGPTSAVPDAGRVTPIPAPPGMRAGHDISVRVHLDSGGPGVLDLKSQLHEMKQDVELRRADGRVTATTMTLQSGSEIPNRDLVLSWRETNDSIENAVFAHQDPERGGFVTLMLMPPGRVDDDSAVAREILFVMDCSGSMKGQPIEVAKKVLSKTLETMRAGDTFNIITFNDTAATLWPEPRAHTDANVAAAQAYLDERTGGGGTEMLSGLQQALAMAARKSVLSIDELVNLPADGREVRVDVEWDTWVVMSQDGVLPKDVVLSASEDVQFRATIAKWSMSPEDRGKRVRMSGRWGTAEGRRQLSVDDAAASPDDRAALPLVLLLTDGAIGNEDQVLAQIRDHADLARFYGVGIGDSPNRFLLDRFSRVGRGVADWVTLNSDTEAAAKRIADRFATPVLANVELVFSEGLEVLDTVPPRAEMPDLWDRTPLVVHARYAKPGRGTVTIKGRTGEGRFERMIDLELPATSDAHASLPSLWARAKVEQITDEARDGEGNVSEEVKGEIIALGTEHQIMTKYTSFVAIEKARVTIAGHPRLVTIPLEMPHGTDFSGFFGGILRDGTLDLAAPRFQEHFKGFAGYGVEDQFGWAADTEAAYFEAPGPDRFYRYAKSEHTPSANEIQLGASMRQLRFEDTRKRAGFTAVETTTASVSLGLELQRATRGFGEAVPQRSSNGRELTTFGLGDVRAAPSEDLFYAYKAAPDPAVKFAGLVGAEASGQANMDWYSNVVYADATHDVPWQATEMLGAVVERHREGQQAPDQALPAVNKNLDPAKVRAVSREMKLVDQQLGQVLDLTIKPDPQALVRVAEKPAAPMLAGELLVVENAAAVDRDGLSIDGRLKTGAIDESLMGEAETELARRRGSEAVAGARADVGGAVAVADQLMPDGVDVTVGKQASLSELMVNYVTAVDRPVLFNAVIPEQAVALPMTLDFESVTATLDTAGVQMVDAGDFLYVYGGPVPASSDAAEEAGAVGDDGRGRVQVWMAGLPSLDAVLRGEATRAPSVGGRGMTIESAVMSIALMVDRDQLAAARDFGAALKAAHGSNELVVQVSEKLDGAHLGRLPALAKDIRLLAMASMDRAVRAAARRLHVQRVLAPELQAAESGEVLVCVLVQRGWDVGEALAGAGLRVEDRNAGAGVVVGYVDVSGLDGVALVPGVLKVEKVESGKWEVGR